MSSSKKCMSCKYSKPIHGGGIRYMADIYCDYLNMTYERRPCKPGNDCTVYERRVRKCRTV